MTMTDGTVGVITLLAGALFCFRGGAALRALMALWGAFVGFGLAAGATAAFAGRPPFSTPVDWVVAILVALVVGALTYAFYALAVAVAVGSIGFGIGTAIATAAGAGNAWAGIIGLVVGVLAAIVALATDLPYLLLVLLGALIGAGAMVAALMLFTGQLDVSHLTPVGVRGALTAHSWWTWVLLALAALGTVVQWRRPVVDDRWRHRSRRVRADGA